MKQIVRPVVGIAVVSALLLGVVSGAVGHPAKNTSAISIPNFSVSDLTASAGDNWIVQEGNLWGQRHSSLSIVTPTNVIGMTEAWHVKLTETISEPLLQLPGEAPQLEYNGTMFAEDEYGGVFALNATTGQQIWTYQPHSKKLIIPAKDQGAFKIAGPWASTRGLAMGDGKIYAEEQLGSVVALNPSTGKRIWSTQIAPAYQGIGMSQPPQYVNGMILGATSGGDTGFPCLVFALNAKTGKLLWKFKLIPNLPSDPGYSTWSHPLTYDGGAAVWSQIGVDPSLGLVYASIGNPIPYGGSERGPGAEYFTCGELALNMKTGKIKWFYQEVHHDTWDADQSQQGMLVNFTYHGVKEKGIIAADKDGLWYVLNRATGKPIIPVTEMPVQQSPVDHTYATEPIPATTPLVPQNVPDRAGWKGLTAADGKPYNIGPGGPAGTFVAITPNQYSVTAAFGQGASGNKPASVDPTNNYLIEETTPGFTTIEAEPNSEVAKLSYFNFGSVLDLKLGSLKGTPAAASGTRLEAMNIATGKPVWVDDRLTPTSAAAAKTAAPLGGGVLTANGIVWTNGGNHLQAFSESNGKLLWSSPALATASTSPPTTYAVGNTQYVTILDASTGDLYAFSVASTKPA
jgi:quinohemoprotein ethanol dehydrogenase